MSNRHLPWRNDYTPSTGFGSGLGKSQVIDATGEAIAAVAIVRPTYERDGFSEATLNEVDATAEFIVRACNSHDALVEALADATEAFRVWSEGRNASAINFEVYEHWNELLALARGEQ